MKVDMRKAYNSIEWSFLEQVMECLQFLEQLKHWIIQCVRTVSYSILINGHPSIPFNAKRA